MKKLLFLLLIAITCISLASCSEEDVNEPPVDKPQYETSPNLTEDDIWHRDILSYIVFSSVRPNGVTVWAYGFQ
jgi:hypothetical protein